MRPIRAVPLFVSSILLLAFVATSGAHADTWPHADWSVTVEPTTIVEGSGTVLVHVTNNGPDAMSGKVGLALPPALAYASSCIPTPLEGLQAAICILPTIASGASMDIGFNVAVASAGSGLMYAAALPGDSIGFTAIYSITDPDVSNNVATAPLTIEFDPLMFGGCATLGGCGGGGGSGGGGSGSVGGGSLTGGGGGSGGSNSASRLAVTITAPANPIPPHTEITIPVSVHNVGGSASSEATLLLQAGSGFLGGDGCSPAGTQATCGLGTIAADATRTVNVRYMFGDSNLTFSASVVAEDATQGTATTILHVAPVVDNSHVVAALIGPSTLQAGQLGSYTLRITNDGTGPAEDVSVDVTGVGGHVVDGGGCTETTVGHLTCTTTEVAVGQITEHLIRASAPTAGTMTLTATPNTGTGGSASTTITAGSTDLSFVTFTASNANPHVGDTITITLGISNLGSVDVNDAYLDSSVPAGWNLGDQSNGPCVLTSGSIHCAFGYIGAGATNTQTLSILADKVGSISATGTAGSSVTDTNSANNAKTLTITVSA